MTTFEERVADHNRRVKEAGEAVKRGETILISDLFASKASLDAEAPTRGGAKVSKHGDLEASSFQDLPAYRYIRKSDNVPTIDQIAEQRDPPALVKLFDPTSQWTWFIAAYDPDRRVAYGRVHGLEDEYGDIWMPELVDLRGSFGLPIERDLHWAPRPLSECSPR